MSDEVRHEEEFEEVPLARYLAIAGVVAVVVAAAAFFAGRASGNSSGPATLAAAVTQAQAGKLPCGTSAQPKPQAGPTGRPDAGVLVAAVCDRNGAAGFRVRGSGFRGFGGSGTAGRVASVNGSTLTIQGRTGTQKVTLGASAKVRRYATGSRSDLEPGDNVIVSGTGGRQTVTVLPASGRFPTGR